ncbi:MAG: DUF1365 domain-containing protein [Planctomycetota bacterium]
MESGLYFGHVRHRRHAPVRHAFRYGLSMLYLDLAELPEALEGRWFWSARRPAIARFRRRDYLGGGPEPLDRAFRDLVEKETGHRPLGAVRLLTIPRSFGYGFNPVSFYYGFDPEGELEVIAAEITNTPWMERRTYVHRVAAGRRRGRTVEFRFPKDFHVSPFMEMDLDYRWRFTTPGDRIVVAMENRRADGSFFDVTLALDRRPLDGPSLARALVRHPLVAAKVTAAIYWQALRLKLKGSPFHDHPSLAGSPAPETRS